MKLVRNAIAGAVAGAVGTAAMDIVWFRRYRRGGGKDTFWSWESAAGVRSWDQASAPGRLGRQVLRALGQDPPQEWARPTTNLVHWATGIGWGLQYGVLAAVAPGRPWARALALGPAAWSASYVILPLAKVYQPIWTYDAATLAKDFSAHLAYGTTTAAAFAAMRRQGSD